MTSFAKTRALVTGAHRGIGAACAVRLARAGAICACADIRDVARTLDAIHSQGGQAVGFECDVSCERSVLTLYSALAGQVGEIDVLVHCAGVIDERPLLETAVRDFDRVVAVNLRGAFLVGREAIRSMRGRGGRVILIGSDLSYAGRETFSAYVASKHGVLGLVRSWAREFAPEILVNAICPGPIDTDMLGAEAMSPEWRRKELDIPLARFGRAEEVAELAHFLASDSASFVTGQGFGINGGSVMP